MEKTELYEWALKGVIAEMKEVEADIKYGNLLIKSIDSGKAKTSLTKLQAINVVAEKISKLEELSKTEHTIKWVLATLEESK